MEGAISHTLNSTGHTRFAQKVKFESQIKNLRLYKSESGGSNISHTRTQMETLNSDNLKQS